MANINSGSSQFYVGSDKYKKVKDGGKLQTPATTFSVDSNDTQKKDFFLTWGKFIWTEYLFGGNMFNQTDQFDTLQGNKYSLKEIRKYALGEQDIKKYRERLDECNEQGKGYININWDNSKILSKFRDIVKGKALSMDFDIRTQAIDETSQKERLGYVNKVKAAINPNMQKLSQMLGATPNVEIPKDVSSSEDVDLLDKMGGFRLDREIFMKDAIEATKYFSGYPTLRNQMIDDIVDWNRAACRVYVEKATNKVKFDYLNPCTVVAPNSIYPDFRDATYIGVVHTKTISQIRKESNLSEKELYEIAKQNKASSLNLNYAGDVFPSIHSINENNSSNDYRVDARINNWDNFYVNVLEFYFVCNEVEKYVIGMRDNREIFEKVKTYSKLSEKEQKKGKSFQEIHTEKIYRGFLVIGSDYVYDCGEEYGIAKKDKNGVREVTFPIQIYADKSPSLMERCIPFVDDLQLAVLKKRNLFAKLPPGPRMGLDMALLKNSIKMGNKTYTMLDLIALFSKTGIFLYESRGEYDINAEGGSNRVPIEHLPTGIAEDMQMLMNEIILQVDNIRQVTGINEVADGSTQQQDMLSGVMNGLNSATNNALKPTFDCYKIITENWVRACVLKWQVAVLGGDIDIAFIPMGDEQLKRIKLTEDLYDYDFGIMISVLPSDEEKQLFIQDLMMQKTNGAIAIDDFFILMNMVKGGDVKRAEMYLSKSVKKQQQILQQQELDKIKAQGEANAQAALAAEQARAQTIQLEAEAKIRIMQAQEKEKRETLQLEYKLKIDLENAKQAGTMQNSLVDNLTQNALTDSMPAGSPTSILEQNQI